MTVEGRADWMVNYLYYMCNRLHKARKYYSWREGYEEKEVAATCRGNFIDCGNVFWTDSRRRFIGTV